MFATPPSSVFVSERGWFFARRPWLLVVPNGTVLAVLGCLGVVAPLVVAGRAIFVVAPPVSHVPSASTH